MRDVLDCLVSPRSGLGNAMGGSIGAAPPPEVITLGNLALAAVYDDSGGYPTISVTINGSAAPNSPYLVTADFNDGAQSLLAPSFTGTVKVGNTLTHVPGLWLSDPTLGQSVTVQWLLDGVPKPGANASVYPIQPADAGKTIAVRETLGADTATSAAVLIPLVTSYIQPFDQTNGTALNAIPDWLQVAIGATARPVVIDGALMATPAAVNGSQTCVYNPATPVPVDRFMEADFEVLGSDFQNQVSLIGRRIDANNWIDALVVGGGVRIREKVAGVEGSPLYIYNHNGTPQTIRFEVQGSTWRLFAGGSLRSTGTTVIASGLPGLFMSGGATATVYKRVSRLEIGGM